MNLPDDEGGSGEQNEVADLFNAIFQIAIRWTANEKDESDILVSADDLERMSDLFKRLSTVFDDPLLRNAILTVNRNIDKAILALYADDLMRSFRLDSNEKDYINYLLSQKDWFHNVTDDVDDDDDEMQGVRDLGAGKFGLSVELRALTREEYDQIVKDFFQEEAEILRRAGLNQSSIAVIIDRLRARNDDIAAHVVAMTQISMKRLLRATNSINQDARSKRDRSREGFKSGKQEVNVASAQLVQSKEKIVGLATLWADAIPLVARHDWGVASVLSATAAATVMVVFPSKPQ